MKALALLSGGLDSTLAIRVMLDEGIEIEAINFLTPFCRCNQKNGCGYQARKVAEMLGVKLKVFSIFDEYLEVLKNPKYGYGKNSNPCIDCRILMHKRAKEYMRKINASFVITGEVLGQRPMSQHRAALKIIEKESGLEGLVLRPLSAKLLPMTIPEKKGWINRERLLEIRGRSRRPQMAKAKELGIDDYPCPAGGCLLTDPGFSRRIKDLMAHSELNLPEVELLKVGRHFRLSPTSKVIVGRNEEENNKILKLFKRGDICFRPKEVKGPLGVGRGDFGQTTINLASQIVARYSDSLLDGKTKIAWKIWPDGRIRLVHVKPMKDVELQKFRI